MSTAKRKIVRKSHPKAKKRAKRVPRPITPTALLRVKRFQAALALARLSQTRWARQEGITQGHLSQVLYGRRQSKSLVAKITAFTNRYYRRPTAAAA